MQHHNANLDDSQFIRLGDTRSEFGGRDALPLLVIDSPFCQATVLLQGAQLLTFRPTGSTPWLWLSPVARFEAGKSPRGGIPVCLPWFGVNRQDPQKPKHGFARNRDWQLVRWQESASAVQLELAFDYAGTEPGLFATPFTTHLVITLSQQIDLALTLANTGTQTEEFSWALHTYFAVPDCTQAHVHGLEGITYLDNTLGLKPRVSLLPVEFPGEVDRVYNHTLVPQILDAQHRLQIDGRNCQTCIVWNAGASAAAGLADIGSHYREYVCVERGRAFADRLTLEAGQTFRADMSISPG